MAGYLKMPGGLEVPARPASEDEIGEACDPYAAVSTLRSSKESIVRVKSRVDRSSL